jgi:hypothetical protein
MNTSIKHALIGSDPELFISKGGVISSAIGMVGGSKEEPRPTEFGALQEDNVLLEFNINPAASLEEFKHHIKAVMGDATNTIAEFHAELVRGLSSHIYQEAELNSFGPSAFIFGCDPDFNGWTGNMNMMPEANPGLRTAGGHLHIGYSHIENPSVEMNQNIIRMCDYTLGLPSILMDKDEQRRELYGKAGCLRHKPYGTEYRTLSNFWLFSDELLAWAYEGARASYQNLGKLEGYYDVVSGEEVQRIINTNDKAAARSALLALEIKYA